MDTFTGMAINPAPLKYAERIGPEPKFCPNCGAKVLDDSEPCDACETKDKREDAMNTLTTKLRCGKTVLAKVYENLVFPMTYANRTQAERKAAELGAGWSVYKGPRRPFFVAFDSAEA
jgi:hypothetical protein